MCVPFIEAVCWCVSLDLCLSLAVNNRVLYYGTSGSVTASMVYGQADYVSTQANRNGGTTPAANSLSGPVGLAVDSSGNLYVAEFGNHRVLMFASGQTIATRVYGQYGSFTSNYANNNNAGASGGGTASASSLNNPSGLALDASNNLYVSDTGRCSCRRLHAGSPH